MRPAELWHRFPAFLIGAIVLILAVWLGSTRIEPAGSGLRMALAAATGTDSGEEVSTSLSRAAELRAQVIRARTELEPWAAWYERLEEAEAEDGIGPGLLRRGGYALAICGGSWGEPGTNAAGEPIGPLATLTDVAGQLRQQGIDFLALPVPPTAVVYPRRYMAGAPPGEAVPPFLDWRLRELYAALEEGGVEVVDLLPTYLAASEAEAGPWEEGELVVRVPENRAHSSVGRLYRLQDPHWTAEGSALAAAVLAERIRRYSWFPEVEASMGRAVVEDRWYLDSIRGPIARSLVASGLLPEDHPAESYLKRRTRIQGEEWSSEDRDSPILLLGDSFANPHHGLIDGLLAELGFRVDRITVPGGEASRQLEVLRLRENGLEGKRLVIWEFTSASFFSTSAWRPLPLVSTAPVSTAPGAVTGSE